MNQFFVDDLIHDIFLRISLGKRRIYKNSLFITNYSVVNTPGSSTCVCVYDRAKYSGFAVISQYSCYTTLIIRQGFSLRFERQTCSGIFCIEFGYSLFLKSVFCFDYIFTAICKIFNGVGFILLAFKPRSHCITESFITNLVIDFCKSCCGFYSNFFVFNIALICSGDFFHCFRRYVFTIKRTGLC